MRILSNPTCRVIMVVCGLMIGWTAAHGAAGRLLGRAVELVQAFG